MDNLFDLLVWMVAFCVIFGFLAFIADQIDKRTDA